MLEQAFLEIPQGKELPIDSLAGQQARVFVTVFDQERADLVVQDRGNESDRGLPHLFQIREGKASKRVAPVVEHLIEVMNARGWHFSSPLFLQRRTSASRRILCMSGSDRVAARGAAFGAMQLGPLQLFWRVVK